VGGVGVEASATGFTRRRPEVGGGARRIRFGLREDAVNPAEAEAGVFQFAGIAREDGRNLAEN